MRLTTMLILLALSGCATALGGPASTRDNSLRDHRGTQVVHEDAMGGSALSVHSDLPHEHSRPWNRHSRDR
jgi:hypothetical protein